MRDELKRCFSKLRKRGGVENNEKTAAILILLVCLLLAGCGEKKEWTYELLEEEFGGVIETDFDSTVTCLRLLSRQSYCVSGYVVNTNDISSGILTLSEDAEGRTSYQITVGQGRGNNYYAEEGETVHVRAQNIESLTDNYYLTTSNVDGGYVSPDKKEEEYLSVLDFIMLMNEIYEDTYFKTEGCIFQDGEDYEGNPRYYLYPSEEAYKENKNRRIEVQFLEKQRNVVGKEVVIIGNPAIDNFHVNMCNCSIVEND